MSSPKDEIFQKIASREEQKKIFDAVIKARSIFMCKSKRDEVFQLIPQHLSKDQAVVCAFPSDEVQKIETPVGLLAQFSLGGEQYFFQGNLELKGTSLAIAISGDIYHLQRRQNYRVKIPSTKKAAADVTHLDSQLHLKAVPIDLSAGGCRVMIPLPHREWQIDDVLKIDFHLGGHPAMKLTGKVRHLKSESSPSPSLAVGIQFLNLTAAEEKVLFSITMELYREFFNRLD